MQQQGMVRHSIANLALVVRPEMGLRPEAQHVGALEVDPWVGAVWPREALAEPAMKRTVTLRV